MAFFEELGKRITDAGQGISQGTKNFADTTRLNNAISDKEKQISQLCLELGKNYYEAHKADPTAEQADIIAGITALFAEIEQAKEEIKTIKGIGKCPQCGADVPAGTAFCSSCGAPIPQAQPQPAAPTGPVCPKCGAPIVEGNLFCTSCGTKLDA